MQQYTYSSSELQPSFDHHTIIARPGGEPPGSVLRSGPDPGGDLLPCLYSNNAIEKLNYLRKQAHCVRENIERFCRDIGIEKLGFLTLTYPDNVVDPKQAYTRFNSFNNNYLRKSEFFDQWICTKERQERGAWHYHLLIDCGKDIKTGFNFNEVRSKNYTSVSSYLQKIWKELRTVLPRYSFGRHELTPVLSNAQGISTYMAKYLYKGFCYRKPEDKGVRLFSTSGKMISSTPKFSWLTDNSRQWRKNVELLCKFVIRSDDYYDLQDHYGKNWAFHLRKEIINLPAILDRHNLVPF